MRRSALLACVVVSSAASLLTLAHCGGATRSSNEGLADSSVAPPDAGFAGPDAQTWGFPDTSVIFDVGPTGAPTAPCPASPPAAGSPCYVSGEQCEYGASWWLECNLVLTCTSGQWSVEPYSQTCPFLDAGGACPSSWAEANALTDAGACPASSCQYPEGACACIQGCGGGGHAPVLTGSWKCMPAMPGCPLPRPALGTSCEDGSCFYAWTCGCGQTQYCDNGVWQGNVSVPCP